MTATPKGLQVLWASLEGQANDGQHVCQVVDFLRKPAAFKQVSSGGKEISG